jgi:hypothetical protein
VVLHHIRANAVANGLQYLRVEERKCKLRG